MTAVFLLLAAALCLGPTLVALRLAARGAGRARLAYAAAALVVALPFASVMVGAVTSTVRSFDGYCHHAPDIRYPCSLPRAVLEGISPVSPFALFGYLMVGAVSITWGGIVLAPTWWLVRRSQQR
ncbi:MAG: hypothetical protein EOO73_28295 [Myxococcales bacterium]|nr:MAG: hypothetical protein EOO73_28295 [Myxococcales bacterium]